MFRRLFVIGAAIGLWFVGGVALEGCRPIRLVQGVTPTVKVKQTDARAAQEGITPTSGPITPTSVDTPQPRSKTVWMWRSARLVQFNTETATLGEWTQEALSEPASTRNKQRQYLITIATREEQWLLTLSGIDVYSPGPVMSVPLMRVEQSSLNVYEDVIAARPLITRDEKTIYAAITAHRGKNWVTYLMRVDPETGVASKPITVFDAAASWGANVNLGLSNDERQVYLVRTFDEMDGADSPIVTRVAVIETEAMKVHEVFEVDQAITADSVWSDVMPAPNGEEIYLFETIWNSSGNGAMRFISMRLEDGRVRVMQTIPRNTLDTGCDARWRFVPDRTALWTWCVTDVQFFDPRTGTLGAPLDLLDPLRVLGSAEYVLASDGKTLYTVYPMAHEIVMADLEKREIVKSVRLQDRAMVPGFRSALAQFLYGTAEAKMGGRPMLAMNPEETWIAFSDITSLDTGDGVWVADARTLEPIGHWMRGQEISGVRASSDGSELYAWNADLDLLQVLNPKTGAELRALGFPLEDFGGMLADAQP